MNRKTLIRKDKAALVDIIMKLVSEEWVLVRLPNGETKWVLVDHLKDVPR